MKKTFIALLFGYLTILLFSQDHPWYDNTLPIDERVDLLVEAMTLEEKIGQLLNAAPEIEHLGVPLYDWWNECLHGVARNGRATIFPQAICLAATFDEDLAYRVATAISDEARAKFIISQSLGNHSRYAGLTFWSPNVNLFRDPRWGRGQETYGEDPYLTSRIGVNFIKGIQGDNEKYLKAAACAKHYVVHSGPEELRHEFDAVVTPKDLWETYMPAFEAAVKEGHVEVIMGAYNRTNGEACCASNYLLTEVLRDQWGFKGHIVSDCGAIEDIWKYHKLCETPAAAAAMSVKSGLNLNCGHTFLHLQEAVKEGLVAEVEIEKALRILLRTRFKLGMFDPVEMNPYNHIDESIVGCRKHQILSLEEARKGMVLVKNDGALPLKKDIANLYVCGPQAANAEVLIGNYFGLSANTVNFLDGLAERVSLGTTINYKYGQLAFRENVNPIDWTTGEASVADACIAIMGISGLYEGEEGEAIESDFKGDKKHIKLPQAQIDFLKKIKAYDNGNPLIVVITGGSPVAIPEVYEIADAVIYAWYPGEQGGTALADIVFGDYSPSGRLPFTVPYGVEDLPRYDDYAMKGRTYRYMEKKPQFPFGFGMSYTSFEFSDLNLSDSRIKKGNDLEFEVTVSNTGSYKADEIVQAYIAQAMNLNNQPLSSLKGFKRISLDPGEMKTLKMIVNAEQLKLVNEEGKRNWIEGNYRLIVGNASPGERSKELGAVFVETGFELK